MSVDVHLFASGIPRRMGAAAFTLASTVEQATGGWNHRVTAVYGTEAIPVPLLDTSRDYPVPPGPMAVGNPGGGKVDNGVYYPTWSAVAPALPYELTPRPVGGGMYKPLGARAMAAGKTLPADLVYQPQVRVRTGGAQGRVTTAPKPQMRWVRQGG